MSKKKAEKLIQDIMAEEASKYLKDVKSIIRKALEKSTLSLMGIRGDSHREYEIDHCNNRNSVLIDAFRRMALKEAENIASTYKPTKEDIVGFKGAFEREFKSQIHYVIRDAAKEKAKKEAQEFISKIEIDVSAFISEIK